MYTWQNKLKLMRADEYRVGAVTCERRAEKVRNPGIGYGKCVSHAPLACWRKRNAPLVC